MFARKYAQPSWSTCPALRSVASGFDDAAAAERQLQRGAERRDLVGCGLNDLLLAAGAVEVRLRRIEPVLADPRVDECPLPVHVLAALLEPPAVPGPAARRGRVRAVEPVGENRPGDVDVDSADRVDQLAEAVEVDEGDVVDVEPGQALHRPQRECRASDLERGVDLGGARARGCRPAGRAGSRGTRVDACRGSVRISMIESERLASPRPGWVPPSVPRTRIVVGVEESSPSCFVSSASTGAGTRALASEMPLREGEVARNEPDDTEEEHDRERERDPPPDVALACGFFGVVRVPANPGAARPTDVAAGPCPLPDRPCTPDRASLVRAFGRIS